MTEYCQRLAENRSIERCRKPFFCEIVCGWNVPLSSFTVVQLVDTSNQGRQKRKIHNANSFFRLVKIFSACLLWLLPKNSFWKCKNPNFKLITSFYKVNEAMYNFHLIKASYYLLKVILWYAFLSISYHL